MCNTSPMRLPYTELWTTFRVTRSFWHPDQAGSLWRGVLGRSLRRGSCMLASSCAERCAEPSQCAYSRLFDPPVPQPAPHALLRSQQEAPPPLLPILPTGTGRTLEAGERIDLGVRCLGALDDADTDRLSRMLVGLAEWPLGRDRGQIVPIAQRPPVRAVLTTDPLRARPADMEPLRACIEFVTPIWIEYEKQLHPALDFPALFAHAARRITVLSVLYGSWTAADEASVPHLRALAATVRTLHRDLRAQHFDRHSKETDQRHPLHGLIGSLTVEGPLFPLLPSLRVAEVIGVGKSTSFGLGRLRITTEPAPLPGETSDLTKSISSS